MTQTLPKGQALHVMLHWIGHMALSEVDAPMHERLTEPGMAGDLCAATATLGEWIALPAAEAIERAQEAYAEAFILPSGPGARLSAFLEGDHQRLGPHLDHEVQTLLDALNKSPMDDAWGRLPLDHVSIACSALAELSLQTHVEVHGLSDAYFMQALFAWAKSLATGGTRERPIHPLYQALGVVGESCLFDLMDHLKERQGEAKSPIRLPVL